MDQLLGLALEQLVDGDARPPGDDRGDVVVVDLLLDHRRRLGSRLALRELRLQGRQLAVADLGDALKLTLALRALGFHPQLVDLALDLGDAGECLLLA